MTTYYTEYPTGEFEAETDESALRLELDAKVIYKQSDTEDGLPMIVIRDTQPTESRLEKIIDAYEIVTLIQDADRIFEKVGGGTKHYVRDVLLPMMQERGIFFCREK